MKGASYCDTSVLVALTTGLHPHRELVIEALGLTPHLHISLHGAAEYFATITKVRLPYAVDPGQARTRVDDLLRSSDLEVVGMTLQSYRRALTLAAKVPLPSGGVYDALHLACAEAAVCRRLYTLNGKDFLRMAGDTDVEIVALR